MSKLIETFNVVLNKIIDMAQNKQLSGVGCILLELRR
jgi:hypothetical protein